MLRCCFVYLPTPNLQTDWQSPQLLGDYLIPFKEDGEI
jgi:hypothetical protein